MNAEKERKVRLLYLNLASRWGGLPPASRVRDGSGSVNVCAYAYIADEKICEKDLAKRARYGEGGKKEKPQEEKRMLRWTRVKRSHYMGDA